MFEYILQTFASIYDYDKSINISYGHSGGDIIIEKGNLDFFERNDLMPKYFIWDDWNYQALPFPFNTEKEAEIITKEKNSLKINYDIVAASFYFLSSWQEIHCDKKDKYGRFYFKESFQHEYDLIRVPVVNYYFDILRTAIEERTGKKVNRRLWPDSPFCVFLSHDIDTIHSGLKKDIKNELKAGNLHKIPSLIYRRMRGKDSWNNIDDVVKIERELEVKSSFYFLPKKDEENADYELSDVQPYFDLIEAASSEIGLHGSLGSGYNLTLLNEEIKALNRNVFGNRFHYLNYDAKITPPILEATSLKYDSSVGFAEQIGFRNGICFPFREYNFDTGKAYNHLQIPLTIMDTTLMDEELMGNFTHTQTQKQIYDLINEVEKFGGVMTVLWHNTYFTNYKYAGWGDRYIDLVKRLKNKDALFLTGREIWERMS